MGSRHRRAFGYSESASDARCINASSVYLAGSYEPREESSGLMSHTSRLDTLTSKRALTHAPAGEAAIQRQHLKGKLTARERVHRLLDVGTFVELDAFAVHRMDSLGLAERKFVGDGVITGYGSVNGRRVFLFSHDFAVLGGSLGEVFAAKICKVMDLALKTGCPFVGINDSGGARIQEGVVSMGAYAEIFWRNVQASGVVPQISLITGPCAGGAVYSPAITDFIFMVDKISQMFITGPEIVKTVTGEEVTFEELGGARTHSKKSGVAQFLCADEDDAFKQIRDLLSFLPQNSLDRPPVVEFTDDPNRGERDLIDLLAANPAMPYDVTEIIHHVFDGGEFFEVHALYGGSLVVGFARLNGESVGVVANQPRVHDGLLDVSASVKGARFVRFCDAFGIPIITFFDEPRFSFGTSDEFGRIVRDGAKLLYAFAEATVPKLNVITRRGDGNGHAGISGKDINSDLNVAWSTADNQPLRRTGAFMVTHDDEITNVQGQDDRTEELVNDHEVHPSRRHAAIGRDAVEELIHPSKTRPVLIKMLKLLRTKCVQRPTRRHGNIPL